VVETLIGNEEIEMDTGQRPFSWRSFAMAMAVFVLAILGISNIALFIAPNCVTAHVMGWTFLGLGKDSWEALSMGFGFVAILLGVFYAMTSASQIKRFLTTGEKRLSRETAVAMVVCLVFVAGSLGNVGPWAALMRWHESHKHGQMARGLSAGGSHHSVPHGCCRGGCGCDGHGSHGECEGHRCSHQDAPEHSPGTDAH
jgi:hypothetical protein